MASRLLIACAGLALLTLAGSAAAMRMAEDPNPWDNPERQGGLYEANAKACRPFMPLKPPAADLPDARARAALKGCDSINAYYGIGQPRDVVKARHCAMLESGAEDEPPLGGAAMLMTIYANGSGVKRDLDLAAHYACVRGPDGAAPAETSGRLSHLAEMKTQGTKAKPFDACDDATSGYLGGFCAERQDRMDTVRRKARLKAAVAKWPAPARSAYQQFQKAENAYIEAHAGEVDLSGTLRAAFVIEAEAGIRDYDLGLLSRLDKPDGFKATPAQRAASDARLNAQWRKIMAHPIDLGTVKTEDVRKSQREWIRYRDAWLALARARGLASSGLDGLAKTLTDHRVKELKDYDPS